MQATEKIHLNQCILNRGVEEIIDRHSLEEKLKSRKTLRIKFGADPTAPDLHLGHVVVLRKLKEFQDAGHTAVFIIGDYTARIGDPSGRERGRVSMSGGTIKKNAKTYFQQAGKIIDVSRAEIHYNSEWFEKMPLEKFITLAGHFSSSRIMDREDFKKRIARGEEVFHQETLYQIMQAYDSVAVRADVELGGRDQKLNVLAGRELQKKMGLRPQDVVVMPILFGLDGKEKMSKSAGNYIALNESPGEIFGKIMSLPDSILPLYFELVLGVPSEEIREIARRMGKENPRDIKLELAERIVEFCHSQTKAVLVRKQFVDIFSKRKFSDIPKKRLAPGMYAPHELLTILGLAQSKSDARRLVTQGALEINKETVKNLFPLEIKKGFILRVGKKKFVKIV